MTAVTRPDPCSTCQLLPEVAGANIFLSLHCNLDCPYCYVEKNQSTMDPGTVEQAIDLVAGFARRRAGFFHTGFLGGEPFLRFPLLRYVSDELEARAGRPISFTVTTNGTVLTADVLGWIQQRDIRVVLSLDGDRAAMNRRPFRRSGQGSYDRVVAGLRRLQEAGVPFLVQMTVNRENVGRLAENVAHVIGLGAPRIILGLASNDAWTTAERADLVRGYGRLFELYKEVFRAGTDVFIKFVHDEVTGYLVREHLGADPMSCGMLRHVVAISVDGGVYPCQAMVNYPEQRVGDVRDGLDRSAVAAAVLPDTTAMPRCSGCALRGFCRKCLAFNLAAGAHPLDNSAVTCTAGRTSAVLSRDFAETMLAEGNPRFLHEFAAPLRLASLGPHLPSPAGDDVVARLVRAEPLVSEGDLPRWRPGLVEVPSIAHVELDRWVPGATTASTGEGRALVDLEFGAYRHLSQDQR